MRSPSRLQVDTITVTGMPCHPAEHEQGLNIMWASTMDGSRFLCREKLGTSLYTAAAILPAIPVDAVPYGSGSTSMLLSQVHHAGLPAACCLLPAALPWPCVSPLSCM